MQNHNLRISKVSETVPTGCFRGGKVVDVAHLSRGRHKRIWGKFKQESCRDGNKDSNLYMSVVNTQRLQVVPLHP